MIYGKAVREVLARGNVPIREFERERALDRGLNDNEVMWALLHKKLQAFEKEDDWAGMKEIYYDIATFLRVEERSFFYMLKQARRCELMEYKEAHVERVAIVTADGENKPCDMCLALSGRMFDLAEVLETMPLPNKACKRIIGGSKEPWCRCSYEPIDT